MNKNPSINQITEALTFALRQVNVNNPKFLDVMDETVINSTTSQVTLHIPGTDFSISVEIKI